MATSLSSRRHSNCLALASISDAVSSIPWVQLEVFHVKFSSPIGSTASWPNIRRKGEYPVVPMTVVLSAQSTAGRWSIYISFGSSDQAVNLDSASAIGLCPCSITPLAAAWYAVTVIIWIL